MTDQEPGRTSSSARARPRARWPRRAATVTIVVGHYVAPTPTTTTTTTAAHDDHVHDVHQRHDLHADTVKPVRVAVLGGGRSSEHEVSLASAASVRDGSASRPATCRSTIEIGRDGVWRRDGATLAVEPGRGLDGVDVVFPVLHGPFGEDGTVQGLLECLDVPYVGAGVLASALCMDKVMFKELMAHAGMPQVALPRGRAEHVRGRARRRARATCARSACRCSSSRRGSARRSGSSASTTEARAAGGARDRVRARPAGDRRGGRARARGRVLGARQRRPDRVRARARSCSRAGESGWYDYEAKYTPGGMRADRSGAACPTASASASGRSRSGVRAVAAAAGWRASTSSSTGERVLAQRAQHDAGLHQHERVRGAVRGQRDPVRRSCSTGSWSSRSSATRRSDGTGTERGRLSPSACRARSR